MVFVEQQAASSFQLELVVVVDRYLQMSMHDHRIMAMVVDNLCNLIKKNIGKVSGQNLF